MAGNTFFQVSTEYDRQAADARKRRRMADLLAQQVIEPTQYGPGPTPAAAPLVQGLQAFLAARAGRKANEAEEGVASAQARAGEQIAGRLTGGAPVREVAPPDASGLGEVKVESQYRASPEDAFRLALTPAGGAAMKGNPMLAAMLAQQMEKPEKRLQLGAVDPAKFTPESIAAAMQANNPSLLKPVSAAEDSRIGKPSPGDFTPASLAQFNQTGDYSVLVPTPRVEPSVNINNRYGSPMSAVDKQGNPVFIQPSQTGGPPSVMEEFRPLVTAPALNEVQSNAAGFADRIASAMPELDRVSPLRSAIVAEGLPLGLGAARVPDRDKRFFQAERSFINAILRKESGAAIAASEFESARRQYIPQPGDGPEVLERKRIERQVALQNLSRAAGPTYKPAVTAKEEVIKLSPRR